MEIITQLDPSHTEKLSYIQQQTQQDVAAILNSAIDLYYQTLQPPATNALQAFQAAGLVGCLDVDPTESYQSVVHNYLDQKYQQETL
jgi:hypothetical protein